MTKELFYTNPSLYEFECKVTKCISVDKHYHIYLNQTCFYPEGGGQAGDRGVLEDYKNNTTIEVYDTLRIDKQIVHVCDKAVAIGTKLHGKIDFVFRRDYMQQHSAQHIISAIFFQEFNIQTKGITLGSTVSTIDLYTESITEFMLVQAETLTNNFVNNNLPITSKAYTRKQLKDLKLRKIANTEDEKLRVCSISDYDRVSCCGVHFENSSAIGLIKFLDIERLKEGITRLSFVAGQRALSLFRQYNKTCNFLKARLSSPTEELAQEFELFEKGLRERIATSSKRLGNLQSLISELLESTGLLHIFDQLDNADFQAVAQILSKSKDNFLLINNQQNQASFIARLINEEYVSWLEKKAIKFGGRNDFYRGVFSKGRMTDGDIADLVERFK